MKRIRVQAFGEPDVMKIEDVPDPSAGPGQVLVKVAAIGVNPVEVIIRTGKYNIEPELPYTPGTDAAGTVEAVGPDVTAFKAGDRVYVIKTVDGAYARKVVSPVDKVFALHANDLGVLAPFGRVVVIGAHGPVEIEPRATMASTLSILGMTLGRATPTELARIHAGLGMALRNDTLHMVVAKKLPLAEAPQAHEAVLTGGTNGKMILVP